MFSQTSEYALRAVVWLAEHRSDGPVGNKRIASDTQVPASYLSKILHDLAAAGFLSSRRGVGGGFQLVVPPDELTMLDVVNAVDPLKRFSFCAHQTEGSRNEMCPMHKRLDRAIDLVQQTLAGASIQDVMHEPSCANSPLNGITRVDQDQTAPLIHAAGVKSPGDSQSQRDQVSPLAAIMASATS